MTVLRSLLLAGATAMALPAAAQIRPDADTLVVALSADITTFDIATVSERGNSNILRHIFLTLEESQPDGTLAPSLAESLEITPDGMGYIYTLREGLTCHDGEALDAESVAYTFNRAADPANRFTGNVPGFIFSGIQFQGAEALDERRVQINVGSPNPIARGLIAEVMIHCREAYEAMTVEEAVSNPVGSGRYRLATWERGSHVILEAVSPDEPIQRLVFRIIPEASTRVAELLAGNVDLLTNVPPDQIDVIEAAPGASVSIAQGLRRIYVGFNLSEEFAAMPGGDAIQDPAVRRALQHAVDVPTICRQLLQFECERATGLVNPPHNHPDIPPYPFDPATAEAMLDEAGWPRGADGTRFPIRLQAGRDRYLNDVNVVLAIAQMLGDVGVDVDVELLDWAAGYVPLIRERRAGPLFFLGTGGNIWSEFIDMNDLNSVNAGTNYTHWDDPRWFDGWAVIRDPQATPEAREATRLEMLRVFYEDGPWLHLYSQPDFYALSDRLNFTPRQDERVYLWTATLD
jgi:peptide/nickel transport system substrate-binding protein